MATIILTIGPQHIVRISGNKQSHGCPMKSKGNCFSPSYTQSRKTSNFEP